MHQAAHLLANAEQHEVSTLKRDYQQLLAIMARQQDLLGTLAPAVAHFQKVTASYGDGLFACYQVNDLPRTNNDLEQFFGTARHMERRVTGRKRASPTLVVRGSVRVVAAGVSRILSVSAAELRPSNVTAWRALRQTLDYRHEGRRRQLRFRRDPQTISPLWNKSSSDQFCRRSFFSPVCLITNKGLEYTLSRLPQN